LANQDIKIMLEKERVAVMKQKEDFMVFSKIKPN
jgi:hypothetical protein